LHTEVSVLSQELIYNWQPSGCTAVVAVSQPSCKGNEENYSQNKQSPSLDQKWKLLEFELRELL
jgi:hypothetical protein